MSKAFYHLSYTCYLLCHLFSCHSQVEFKLMYVFSEDVLTLLERWRTCESDLNFLLTREGPPWKSSGWTSIGQTLFAACFALYRMKTTFYNFSWLKHIKYRIFWDTYRFQIQDTWKMFVWNIVIICNLCTILAIL